MARLIGKVAIFSTSSRNGRWCVNRLKDGISKDIWQNRNGKTDKIRFPGTALRTGQAANWCWNEYRTKWKVFKLTVPQLREKEGSV